jgi:hypothetical protein
LELQLARRRKPALTLVKEVIRLLAEQKKREVFY